jgi:predicted nucleic acid-binding protein
LAPQALKFFLDANVVFSAAHRDHGRAWELIALSAAASCTVVTSRHALAEARRNLDAKSRGFDERLTTVLARVTLVGEAPAIMVEWARGEGLPSPDAIVLAAAVHARSDYLVTGDKRDFGSFYGRTLRGVQIIPPARALDVMLKLAGA